MTRPQSKFADPAAILFQDNQIPRVASSRFWAYLVRYRPVFLVGGLWMLLICLAAGAYSRLMFIGLPPKPAVQPPLTRPHEPFQAPRQNRDQSRNDDGSPELQLEFAAPKTLGAVAEESDSDNFAPRWPLLLMVGLCALGCGVVSQQARRPQKPLSKPRRKLVKANRSGPKPTSRLALTKPKAPTRLPVYSSERDAALVPGKPAVVETEGIFQPTYEGGSTHVVSPSHTVQLTSTAPVSVVPEQETHPLDWPEGNLADTLDLRQHRSLSSFL